MIVQYWDPEGIAAYVRESCAAQGVPVKVTDPTVIRKVATLFLGHVPVERSSSEDAQVQPASAELPPDDRR